MTPFAVLSIRIENTREYISWQRRYYTRKMVAGTLPSNFFEVDTLFQLFAVLSSISYDIITLHTKHFIFLKVYTQSAATPKHLANPHIYYPKREKKKEIRIPQPSLKVIVFCKTKTHQHLNLSFLKSSLLPFSLYYTLSPSRSTLKSHPPLRIRITIRNLLLQNNRIHTRFQQRKHRRRFPLQSPQRIQNFRRRFRCEIIEDCRQLEFHHNNILLSVRGQKKRAENGEKERKGKGEKYVV